jgi:hypothetical protein
MSTDELKTPLEKSVTDEADKEVEAVTKRFSDMNAKQEISDQERKAIPSPVLRELTPNGYAMGIANNHLIIAKDRLNKDFANAFWSIPVVNLFNSLQCSFGQHCNHDENGLCMNPYCTFLHKGETKEQAHRIAATIMTSPFAFSGWCNSVACDPKTCIAVHIDDARLIFVNKAIIRRQVYKDWKVEICKSGSNCHYEGDHVPNSNKKTFACKYIHGINQMTCIYSLFGLSPF